VNPDDPSDPIAIFTPRDPKPGPASPSTLKGAITEKEIVNSTNIIKLRPDGLPDN